MVRIKICGITRWEDAQAAVTAGADAIGFIFYKKSPRYISPAKALKISRSLPPFVSKVGVFVNEKAGAVLDIVRKCGLDYAQLHGDEEPRYCQGLKREGLKVIKVFRVGKDFKPSAVKAYRVDAFLFDTGDNGLFGGTGRPFAWELLKELRAEAPVILSGGLTVANVRKGIAMARPFAVDVSSGVEILPGIKDPLRVAEFLKKVSSL